VTSATEHRKLAAIMFTDMVGYSALAQRNEALALELLEEHRRLVRDILPRHGGREVKTTGDGFLIEFPSALAAVQCAVDVQQALHHRSQTQPADRQVRIRIGIHVGDVVLRDGDIHGDGVNIAARIEPLAEPGGICVSEDVARQVGNKVEHPLAPLGPAELKHIELPVVVHRVCLPWQPAGRSSAGPAGIGGPRGRSRTRVAAWGAAVVGAMLLLTAVVWWVQTHRPGGAGTGAIRSLAVGLTSDSTSPEQQAWARMMTELLVSHLSKIKPLDVYPLSAGKPGEDAMRAALEQGRRLKVDAIVDGTVHYASNEVLIIPRLREVATGRVIWSDPRPRQGRLDDMLGLQQRLAADIASEIRVTLTPTDRAELGKKATENPEALKAYLQGRASWLHGNEAGFSNAIVHFERAVSLDPQYALAHAGLADAYSAATSTHLHPTEGYRRGKHAASKALELNPNLADAHTALGMAIMLDEWNWPEAERHLKRAIELDPNLAQARNAYCNFLVAAARLDEAVREGREAVRLNPYAASYRLDLGYAYLVKGDLSNALAEFKAAEGLDESNSMVHLNYGWLHMLGGDAAAAERSFREAQRLRPEDPLSLAGLDASLSAQGRRADALNLVQQLDDLGKRRFVQACQAADIYAWLGETDQAIARLEQALEQKENAVPWIRVAPDYVLIRTDPRFQALVKRVFAGQ